MKTDIAGVGIDNVTSQEALERIKSFIQSGTPHQVVTVYSEFVVQAQDNPAHMAALNRAGLSLADGVGILWAAKFLSLPKRNPIVTALNWFGSLCSIVLAPRHLRSVIKEQVTGSRLVWDIARIAQENNYSIALVGGFDGVAERSAEALKARYPGLRVNLAYGPAAFDENAVAKISQSNSDILLVAYQPPRQELWIADNLSKLNVKVAMGLGGTFDYLSGKRSPAPDIFHKLGLEWLWRLITQPWRIKRMWRALVTFSLLILKRKLNQ